LVYRAQAHRTHPGRSPGCDYSLDRCPYASFQTKLRYPHLGELFSTPSPRMQVELNELKSGAHIAGVIFLLRLHPARIRIGVANNIAHGNLSRKRWHLVFCEALLNVQEGFWQPLLPQRARGSRGLPCNFVLSVYHSREVAAAWERCVSGRQSRPAPGRRSRAQRRAELPRGDSKEIEV